MLNIAQNCKHFFQAPAFNQKSEFRQSNATVMCPRVQPTLFILNFDILYGGFYAKVVCI